MPMPIHIHALLLLLALVPLAAAQPTWANCGRGQGNYSAGSTYETNLVYLLRILRSNASNSPSRFASGAHGAAPDTAWALVLCRGDVSAPDCYDCVSTAIRDAATACNRSMDVAFYYSPCYVRLSDVHDFLDPTGNSGEVDLLTGADIISTDVHAYQQAVTGFLTATVQYAVDNSSRLFATGHWVGPDRNMYSAAQCAPDLSPAQCRNCLQRLVGKWWTTFPHLDLEGASIAGPRCTLRYQVSPFYIGSAMLQQTKQAAEPAPAPAATATPTRGSKSAVMKIMLIAAAATLLFPCIYMLTWHRKGRRLWFILCNKSSRNNENNYEAMIASYGSLAPKRYMYSDVMKITFSRSNELGKGGYGVVFKGRLHDGRLVAVKFLHDSKGNRSEFVNEVMSIGRTSHVNVVTLFGFCLEGSKRALIYEYMSNSSLDKFIYSENPKEVLGWERLYEIALGIAHGLQYLHYSCNTRIIHFDIKPQNILLDSDFSPKIADFGLAKLCHMKESKVSMTGGARGTIGFIAPEVHSRTFGVVSTKSDVYSYGMMLLEMVGGRRNVKSIVEKSSEKYFPDWIYDHFSQDEGLQACDVTSETTEIARKMTLIGMWCIQVLPMYRPTITRVLEMFERSLDELEMPPQQNFCELDESSSHNMEVQSASSTSTRFEKISHVNSKNLQRLPTLSVDI
ncbi:hypothetical protein VPH35_070719 [Triticum aestivum]